MKRFSHWVFDLDGTLIDSGRAYELSIETILLEFGLVPTPEDIERAYRFFNPIEYFETFFQETAKIDHAVRRLVDLNRFYADQILSFVGIENLLIYLKSKEVHISVWTGRELQSAKLILENTKLSNYVGLCVGGTCIPRNKPHPDGLMKILEESKHHGDDVVMVGDHEYDMRGAQAARVKAVSVSWNHKAHPGARELSDLHFDQPEELLTWARSLYEKF